MKTLPLLRRAAVLLLLCALGACTRDQVATGLLGGAKNWCRHSNGVCHVDGKLSP